MQPRAQDIANHPAWIINAWRCIHGEAKWDGVHRFPPFFRGAAAPFIQNGAKIGLSHGAASNFPL
jgi:hypothetical protein